MISQASAARSGPDGFHELGQIAAIDELRHQEMRAADASRIGRPHDIGVIQPANRPAFVGEAGDRFRIAERLFRDEFDGNGAAEPNMRGLVDRAHAAGADLLAKFVVGQRSASGRRASGRGIYCRMLRRAFNDGSRPIDGRNAQRESPHRRLQSERRRTWGFNLPGVRVWVGRTGRRGVSRRSDHRRNNCRELSGSTKIRQANIGQTSGWRAFPAGRFGRVLTVATNRLLAILHTGALQCGRCDLATATRRWR